MLSDKNPIAMLAVKDLKAAAKFYEGTLGLDKDSTDSGGDMKVAWFKDPAGIILSIANG